MRRRRRTFIQVKGKDSFFDLSVSLGNPSMLAKVFAPRFHQKNLPKMPRVGRIAIQTPSESAITPANASHLSHDVTKFSDSIRIDVIFDNDQYRSSIRFGFYYADRFRPMHPRLEAQFFATNQTIAKPRGKTD